MRLEPLALWFQPAAGALLPQLRPFLLAAGQAQAGASARLLRWAITAAEPARGLRIEAVLVVGGLGTGAPSDAWPRFGSDANRHHHGDAPGQHLTAGEGPRPNQASEGY